MIYTVCLKDVRGMNGETLSHTEKGESGRQRENAREREGRENGTDAEKIRNWKRETAEN